MLFAGRWFVTADDLVVSHEPGKDCQVVSVLTAGGVLAAVGCDDGLVRELQGILGHYAKLFVIAQVYDAGLVNRRYPAGGPVGVVHIPVDVVPVDRLFSVFKPADRILAKSYRPALLGDGVGNVFRRRRRPMNSCSDMQMMSTPDASGLFGSGVRSGEVPAARSPVERFP